MSSSIARAGALAAGLVAPVGFDPSLMPRTAAQQGLVTGASASATLGAVALGQVLTAAVARRIGPVLGADPQARTVRAAADACVLGTGLVAQRLLAQRPREPLGRAIGRTAGYELALGSGAALVTSAHGRSRRPRGPAHPVARARPAHGRGCGPGRTRAATGHADPGRRCAPTGTQPGVRRCRSCGPPGRGERRAWPVAGGGYRSGGRPARTRATVGVDRAGWRRRDHWRGCGSRPGPDLRADRVRGRAGGAGARGGAERPVREWGKRQRGALHLSEPGGSPARADPDPRAAHRAGHGQHRRRGADPRLRGAGERPDDRAAGGPGPAGGRPPRRPGPIGAAARLTHRHGIRQLRRGRSRRVPRPRRRRHRDDAVLAATLVPVPGPGPTSAGSRTEHCG